MPFVQGSPYRGGRLCHAMQLTRPDMQVPGRTTSLAVGFGSFKISHLQRWAKHMTVDFPPHHFLYIKYIYTPYIFDCCLVFLAHAFPSLSLFGPLLLPLKRAGRGGRSCLDTCRQRDSRAKKQQVRQCRGRLKGFLSH